MTALTRTAKLLGCLCLLAAVTLLPSTAEAGAIRARVDAPVVVADQIFDAGEIALAFVGNGSLMAVRIDGRQVALVHHQLDGRSSHGDPILTFERDERGNYHLKGLRYADGNRAGARGQFVPLKVATVARGDRTLAPTAVASAEPAR